MHTFHGTTSRDPVTDQPIIHYPTWKRRLWYLFSFLAMLPLLSLGVAVMTLSLNLNGYVQDKKSPIYFGWLACYAEPVSVGALRNSPINFINSVSGCSIFRGQSVLSLVGAHPGALHCGVHCQPGLQQRSQEMHRP